MGRLPGVRDLSTGPHRLLVRICESPFGLSQDPTQKPYVVVGKPEREKKAAQLDRLDRAVFGLQIAHTVKHSDGPLENAIQRIEARRMRAMDF